MSKVIHLENIADLHLLLQQPKAKHPLLSVVDFTQFDEQFGAGLKISSGFYTIMYKNYCVNTLKYGRHHYDFQEGSLMCIAPQQVITLDEAVEKRADAMGWGLFFHPDLIRGTALGQRIKDYTFFSYETNEALHLSEKEEGNLFDCVQKINAELAENIDRHSQTLLVSNLELLLNYCTRYYDRQFITRKNANKDILSKVEELLTQYFQSPNTPEKGLPTVKYLADQVFLSPNYLSDLLKRETGMNAQDHIHYHLIEEAKNLLLNSNQSVGELAFALGFEYPQYFSRLFKAKTGMTPVEFRNGN
jgi:AraC-like DNA-binding protein